MVGKGLQNSGLVDVIGHGMVKIGKNPGFQAFSLLLLVSIASAFMNNVGALVILMPVAINLSRKNGQSPSAILMPLSFGSLLGGMMTMTGTPPNIIIGTFRTEAAGLSVSADPFLMAIAVGTSCAFLTPIGHQSNTIVMGPGGYKFIDYLKMGIPLSLIIVLISVPMILLVWPL
ncbi:SLC13 family permease [Marispirochaeta sp.]|uniref:SLC13 family permease n=1 Tax=Marispirochaeta sp. TaxID=2038653 RepID=UPI0029C675B5|nr:SLC13 family permease [Marispirochaeta sp.]